MGGVYNSNDTANSANVNFDFGLALQAARDLYALSGKVTACQSARASAATSARPDWSGPKRDSFDTKMSTEAQNSSGVSEGLVTLANAFAKAWSEARGEQDRINMARYVQHQQDSENWAESAWDSVAGQHDYGAPPQNPPVPTAANGFAPTRKPVHPEYEYK